MTPSDDAALTTASSVGVWSSGPARSGSRASRRRRRAQLTAALGLALVAGCGPGSSDDTAGSGDAGTDDCGMLGSEMWEALLTEAGAEVGPPTVELPADADPADLRCVRGVTAPEGLLDGLLVVELREDGEFRPATPEGRAGPVEVEGADAATLTQMWRRPCRRTSATGVCSRSSGSCPRP